MQPLPKCAFGEIPFLVIPQRQDIVAAFIAKNLPLIEMHAMDNENNCYKNKVWNRILIAIPGESSSLRRSLALKAALAH